jgi:hypothetical protein
MEGSFGVRVPLEMAYAATLSGGLVSVSHSLAYSLFLRVLTSVALAQITAESFGMLRVSHRVLGRRSCASVWPTTRCSAPETEPREPPLHYAIARTQHAAPRNLFSGGR